MTGTVVQRCPSELGGLVCRFFGSRRELDTPLLGRLYYVGLTLLGVWGVTAVGQAVNLAIDAPGGGTAGVFFFVSAFVGVATLVWRLICELAVGVLLLLP